MGTYRNLYFVQLWLIGRFFSRVILNLSVSRCSLITLVVSQPCHNLATWSCSNHFTFLIPNILIYKNGNITNTKAIILFKPNVMVNSFFFFFEREGPLETPKILQMLFFPVALKFTLDKPTLFLQPFSCLKTVIRNLCTRVEAPCMRSHSLETHGPESTNHSGHLLPNALQFVYVSSVSFHLLLYIHFKVSIQHETWPVNNEWE